MDTAERLAQLIDRITKGNHRMTPQRRAILEILVSSENHPSVDSIYAQVRVRYPAISLATVYKTIHLLKEKGEVLELEFSDLGNRYDGNRPYPHPHVICTRCGAIVDPSSFDMESLIARTSEETGFSITTHRLDFFGICPECRRKDAK